MSICRWGIELGLNVRIYKFQRVIEGSIIGVWWGYLKVEVGSRGIYMGTIPVKGYFINNLY